MKSARSYSRIALTLATASLAIGVTGCAATSAGDAQPDTAGGTTVTIGTLKGQPHLYHPYFYEQFAPEGVTVEVVAFDTSPDVKNAVVSGAVDFGVTGVPSAVAGISQGEDIKIIGSAADGGSGFVGNSSIKTVDDLVGKKVGFPQGASQEILLRLTLENAGVDIDDLQLVNLPFSDMANALASESIDAFLSAELAPSIAQLAGAHVIASPYETRVGKVNIGLITTQALIESDPDLVQSVVDTHVETTDHMLANTDLWAEGAVETFGLDADVVEKAITNISLRYDLSTEYQEQVTALTEEMAVLKTITSEPTVDELFDTTFIDAAAE